MSATVPTGAPQKVFVRARRQISALQAILKPGDYRTGGCGAA